MFLVVDKRKLLIGVCVILVICLFCATGWTLYCALPKPEYTVVIDAGHGGGDKGVKGAKTDVSESEINLLVAFNLKNVLEERGVKVVLTREKDSVLEDGIGTKADDFERRKSIINEAKPNLVVSIHQNKFPDSTRRGAQVFFNEGSEEGKNLARAVQASLNEINNERVGRTFSALKGDYYILNCSFYPSCIIECGFLSNEEDEKLLTDAQYRELLSNKISNGIFAYLNEKSL